MAPGYVLPGTSVPPSRRGRHTEKSTCLGWGLEMAAGVWHMGRTSCALGPSPLLGAPGGILTASSYYPWQRAHSRNSLSICWTQ